MAKNPTPQQWAATLLQQLGIHQTPGAVQAITGWERAEGGHWNNSAKYNPLNTTQSAPGAGNTGSQGNIKVYKDWDQGLQATVQTLKNGRYNGILSALRSGDPAAVANAIGQTPWGTSGDLVTRTIMGTPRVAGVQGFDAGSTAQPQAETSTAGSPSAPQPLDAGQGSDFTSLLGSLLAKPQPAQQGSTPLQAPAFAAAPKLPGGFQAMLTSAAPAAPAQSGVSDALGLVAALGGSGPSVGTSGGSQTADGPQTAQASSGGSSSGGGTGADAALSWAKSKIGFKETGANSGGLASYANSRFGMSNQPWCAMFTSLAVTKGGAPKSARTASVATVRSKAQAGDGYEKGFVDPHSAQSGDLILFGDQHIGMVDHVANGKIVYVGGNQSNGVTQASVPVGTGDIVRPKYGAR